MESKQLLFKVAHCTVVESVFISNLIHPCKKIIESQGTKSLSKFQLSEPWNGRIEVAPILFISSNPSINDEEDYPVGSWPDNLVEDFCSNRFEGKHKKWVEDGRYSLMKDQSYSKLVRFWSAVRKRAEELFERDVVPGSDYALTEVVHCKSRSEIGVKEAVDCCSQRYLGKILKVSGATVIVLLGDKAKIVFQRTFLIPDHKINDVLTVNLGGKERYVCYLPHPNARMKRTFDAILSPDVLSLLRRKLQNV